MTDNEIIKALKFHSDPLQSCVSKCVYGNQRYCGSEMAKDALALINRQKAEIEEYRNTVERVLKKVQEAKALLEKDMAKARAEAVKEFAFMLKAMAAGRLAWDEYDEEICGFLAVDELDNLVKEFTEGGDTE